MQVVDIALPDLVDASGKALVQDIQGNLEDPRLLLFIGLKIGMELFPVFEIVRHVDNFDHCLPFRREVRVEGVVLEFNTMELAVHYIYRFLHRARQGKVVGF